MRLKWASTVAELKDWYYDQFEWYEIAMFDTKTGILYQGDCRVIVDSFESAVEDLIAAT